MRRLLSVHLLLLLQTLFSPGSSQFHEVCAENNYIGEGQYSHLFSKLEEALVHNKTLINLLRQIFMGTENGEIHFSVQLEVVNGTNLPISCDNPHNYTSFDTFCLSNSSDYKWKLCNIPEKYGFDSIEMTYTSQSPSKIKSKNNIRESEIEKQQIDAATAWLSLLHGNVLPTFFFVPDIYFYFDGSDYFYGGSDYFYDWDKYDTSMTLVMERLDCNPSIAMTQCALSELLSWVSKLVK